MLGTRVEIKSLEKLKMQLLKVKQEINDLSSYYIEVVENIQGLTGAEKLKKLDWLQQRQKLEIEQRKDNVLIKEVLVANNKAMNISEITDYIVDSYPQFIPSNIINVKSFIDRKLKRALVDGAIVVKIVGWRMKYYGLKEWD